MTSLTRTSSSGYDLNQAVDLETIEAEVDTPEKWLQPIDSFFAELPQLQLSPDQFKRVSNGASINLNTSYAKVALVITFIFYSRYSFFKSIISGR